MRTGYNFLLLALCMWDCGCDVLPECNSDQPELQDSPTVMLVQTHLKIHESTDTATITAQATQRGKAQTEQHALHSPHRGQSQLLPTSSDAALTEAVLELFPDLHMTPSAKDRIRRDNLIPAITAWMRRQASLAWDGFDSVDDLTFWRAHQWEGGNHESWAVLNGTANSFWVGQPSKIDGQPLRMKSQVDNWYTLAFYNFTMDIGTPFLREQFEKGMSFVYRRNIEAFMYPELSFMDFDFPPSAISQMPLAEFAPFQPQHAQHGQFVPYVYVLTWHGFMLEGPGYTVEFVDVLDSTDPYVAGKPNIVHSVVYGTHNQVTASDCEALSGKTYGAGCAFDPHASMR